MAATRNDHKVAFRTEEAIARTASRWREIDGTSGEPFFDTYRFMTVTLLNRLNKGAYTLEFDETLPPDRPAFVKFRPSPTLHTRRDAWGGLRLHRPGLRFVFSHEAGHMILHDHEAKAFSDDPREMIQFAELEYSAEWQANTFADHLLIPTSIVSRYTSADALAQACRVSIEVAARRIKSAQYQWWPID